MIAKPAVAWGTKTFTSPSPPLVDANSRSSAVRSSTRVAEVSCVVTSDLIGQRLHRRRDQGDDRLYLAGVLLAPLAALRRRHDVDRRRPDRRRLRTQRVVERHLEELEDLRHLGLRLVHQVLVAHPDR